MQNISKNALEKLQAQLGSVMRIRESIEQEYRRVVIDFLYEHTKENHCFTETIVLKNGRLKMAYALGEMSMYPTLSNSDRGPLPIFFIKESAFTICYGDNYKEVGPILVHEPHLHLLDNPNLIELLKQRVQEENTYPQISIPQGFMAFRFEALWAAGGYDDDHPTQYDLPFEAGSLEEGFKELKQMLRVWHRENHFGNFWVAQPGLDTWQKLKVEPEHANYMPFVSQISLGELKLVGKEDSYA